LMKVIGTMMKMMYTERKWISVIISKKALKILMLEKNVFEEKKNFSNSKWALPQPLIKRVPAQRYSSLLRSNSSNSSFIIKMKMTMVRMKMMNHTIQRTKSRPESN
jgi:hypothetical protein